jgi:predicted nuclease of predicted toxin-antitoxin system
MKVRFQADADLKHAIVRATLRREPTIDFRSATSADLAGRDDMEVLAIAAREGRVLVSHDNRTIPTHFAEFISNNT